MVVQIRRDQEHLVASVLAKLFDNKDRTKGNVVLVKAALEDLLENRQECPRPLCVH